MRVINESDYAELLKLTEELQEAIDIESAITIGFQMQEILGRLASSKPSFDSGVSYFDIGRSLMEAQASLCPDESI